MSSATIQEASKAFIRGILFAAAAKKKRENENKPRYQQKKSKDWSKSTHTPNKDILVEIRHLKNQLDTLERAEVQGKMIFS